MKAIIYDNRGITFDRYTVIIRTSLQDHIYTMSYNPLSPQGYNQYSHSCSRYNSKDQQIKFKELSEELQTAINLKLGLI